MSRWLICLMLCACSESGLNPITDGPGGVDTDGDGIVDGEGSAEVCNGVDDDLDGLVDEGFTDYDGDGVADCVDDDCSLFVTSEVEADRNDACGADIVIDDPWSATLAWQWEGLSFDSVYNDVLTTPVIGNLTDDDGDGDIDRDDIPEVVFPVFDKDRYETGGFLVVLDGATGEEVWTADDIWGMTGATIADANGDGLPEVVAVDSSGHPVLFAADGSMIWRASVSITIERLLAQTTVADVDADGTPEILVDNLLLNGKTGELLTSFPIADATIPWRMSAVGDIDLDGEQEIILGNNAYRADGTRLWGVSVQGQYGHFNALVNADSDAFAEIVMIANGELLVIEHDGAVTTRVSAGNDHPGAPCIADFDGDGMAEVTWASNTGLHQYELDGTRRWTVPTDDATNAVAGCSGYDFDGDGTYEILYADNSTFSIFDALTGGRLFQWGGHASTTAWEYPTVADIDRDGSAEIVVASNDMAAPGFQGISVFEHIDSAWLEGGPTWHVHDFAVTNITPDGIVPASPTPPWLVHNVFRARPTQDTLSVDLQAAIVDVCWTGCASDSIVQVSVQVWNGGVHASPPSVPIALYTRYGEALELLAVERISGAIPPTTAIDGIVFEVEAGQVGPDGFVVVVDDDGQGGQVIVECDEENNAGEWRDVECLP